jgi:hypothetical protein
MHRAKEPRQRLRGESNSFYSTREAEVTEAMRFTSGFSWHKFNRPEIVEAKDTWAV